MGNQVGCLAAERGAGEGRRRDVVGERREW